MARSGAKKSPKTTSTGKLPATKSTVPSSAPALFDKLFLANLLPDDLAHLSRTERDSLTASVWQLAQKRPRGTVSLRVFNPSLDNDGWTVDHTVLEIISDDMPFLVDSVTGELHRRGLNIHLFIHPVLHINRKANGQLENLIEDDSKAAPEEAESFMHVQFDNTVDQVALDDLAKSIREILAEIASAVADWQQMRHRNRDAIQEISNLKNNKVAADEVEEAKIFLRWLDNNSFTYLGYRCLDLVKKGDELSWNVRSNSGLGILRDPEIRLFGGIRDLATQPSGIKHFLQQRQPIVVIKTNHRARIHRTVPMDAIFVQRFDDKGQVIGEHLFVGLFTSRSYSQSPLDVPFLRHKISRVVARANFDPAGHDGKALLHILENYPRDELFQINTEELFKHSLGIVQLQERSRTALFVRTDPFYRFVTCLIYVPRERYDSVLRLKLQKKLSATFGGPVTDYNTRVDDSPLARVFLTIALPGKPPKVDLAELESEVRELTRAWADLLRNSLVARHKEAKALDLLRRYGDAFPATYREHISPANAVHDIQSLERVQAQNGFVVDLAYMDKKDRLHIKLFQPDRMLALSDVLPLIENMGLKVDYMSGPHEISPIDTQNKIYLHEYVCHPAQNINADLTTIKPLFEEAFTKIWVNEIENDPFNALTLYAALPWRETMLLRAMARYLRQLRIPYSHEMIAATLINHPAITQQLVKLFVTLHDPVQTGKREVQANKIVESVNEALVAVNALEEDRIIRRYMNLIQSLLRTNYFQPDADGNLKSYLSLKFNSRAIDYMPLPKPLVEIFVYSPRVEAVHLRGGKIARGGIRWSDRRDDFRNEILGLMKAQMVKNSVIVPVGSKGGFIVKQPPQEIEKYRAEGVACYRIMMSGLLDITDNLVNGKIVPPKNVVRHDEDDPYLVVAADKGTAQFSDIANGISQEYNFWLDDAFASGGSVGYDHKHMGITARGAWEAVKRHFRELDRNIQTTTFTCMGVGDMSGDVFGNGMLLSPCTKLIGAFDHRHIFCDPNPDIATSYAERERLFKLPHSSWNDYDRKKLSKGGDIFSRTAKTIKLTPEIRKAYGLTTDVMAPSELIQAMLRCEVDLLYFGGIGTYVKSTDETPEDVGDRTNDANRVDASELKAKVVGEGANLGMTQRARIEYALRGGHLNTDAIDNSAGVDTSDHEVNIKILLRKIVQNGSLPLNARNKLLATMTDDVAKLVLRDNYLQTGALTVAEAQSIELLPHHARTIRMLEKTGLLNRAVEFLPDEAEITERQHQGKGLTRPELAVLLSYSKIWLYDQLLASNLPDDDCLHDDLISYFPPALQKKYPSEIAHHQLKRELTATILTNDLVNRMGSHFVFDVIERTNKKPAAIARAYLLVRTAFNLPKLQAEIESLDNVVAAKTQIAMALALNHVTNYVVPWFLTQTELPSKLGKAITQYSDGVKRLTNWLSKMPEEMNGFARQREKDLLAQKVPAALARHLAILPWLATAPDITQLSAESGRSVEESAVTFFGLGHRLELDALRKRAETLAAATPWQREAVASLLGDLFANQRVLTKTILGKGKDAGKNKLASWLAQNKSKLESYDAMLAEFRAANNFDIAMLTLASRHLAALVK